MSEVLSAGEIKLLRVEFEGTNEVVPVAGLTVNRLLATLAAATGKREIDYTEGFEAGQRSMDALIKELVEAGTRLRDAHAAVINAATERGRFFQQAIMDHEKVRPFHGAVGKWNTAIEKAKKGGA